MNQCIDPSDPQYFTESCSKLYNRHKYKLRDDAVDVCARDLQRVDGALTEEVFGGDDLLGRHVGLCAGHGEQIVEVEVRAKELAVALFIGTVHVEDHGVHIERGNGDEFFTVAIGGGDGAEFGVLAQHGRAEAGPGRVEGHPVRSGHQAEIEGALVEFHEVGQHPALAHRPEVWFERNRVERHEAVGDLATLAGGGEDADIGAAVAHDVEVGEIAAQDRPHERHGLPPRSPPADADRHPALELTDDLILGHALVGHAVPLLVGPVSDDASDQR